ncbi:hypothetical protein [Azospirillum sp.]|uniref:hypothetical protein n=1 Tax=Azospirillum sp. TaxID=34012 RepID=UPI003D72C858
MSNKPKLHAGASSGGVLLVMASFPAALQLQQVLVSSGHEVAGVVSNTRDAVRFAKEHKPGVAVVDMALPEGERGPALARTLYDKSGVHSVLLSSPDDPVIQRGGVGLQGVVGVLPNTGEVHDTARAIGMILHSSMRHEGHAKAQHSQGTGMIFDLYCFISDLGVHATPDLRDKVKEAAAHFEVALRDLKVPFSIELRDARSNRVILASVYTGAKD